MKLENSMISMNKTINKNATEKSVQSVVESCDVVVVGAGPTGLTVANSLYQHGIRCKIYDTHSEILKFDSKCTTTHIRVLEIFEQLGILDEFNFEEYLVDGLIFKSRYKHGWKSFLSIVTDFSKSEGIFWNHALSTPQWKLEMALLSALQKKGGDVNYDTKLLDFRQDKERVIVNLYDAINDRKIQINCKYLVGCDGVKSTVREQLKIKFIGKPYKDFFIIADVYINNFDYEFTKRYTFSDHQYHMHFAHLGDKLFRVFITYYEAFVTEDHLQLWVGSCKENPESSQKTLQWFQKQVYDLDLNYELYDPIRFSSYKVFLGYAKESRKGRVFLAGDAAHSHTPHGGQGMNTGVMDAHNLAWKLAHSIQEKTKPIVLNSYEEEREPEWQKLVKRTDFIKNIVERKKRLMRFTADYILPILPKSGLTKAGKKISMLSISYRQSSISRDQEKVNLQNYLSRYRQRIRSGDRLPDCYMKMVNLQGVSSEVRLQHILFGENRIGDYSILYFNPHTHANTSYNYDEFQSLAKQYNTLFRAKMAWFYVVPENISSVQKNIPILVDTNDLIFKLCGIYTKTLFLIRPDGYIAYRNQPFNPKQIMNYFREIFLQC